MDCLWIVDAADHRVKICARRECGNRIVSDYPPEKCHADCLSPDAPDGPPAWKRAMNFAKAVFHQAPLAAEAVWTGDESKAFRSQEEIEAIATICKACPLLVDGACSHPDCGCPIDGERAAFWSKLAWKSQACPDNPPRWT